MKPFNKQHSEASKYPLNMQEVSQLINAAKTLRDKVIIGAAYYAGLRRFEIAKMMKSEINFEKGRITVKGKRNKIADIPVGSVFPEFMNDLKFYLQSINNREGYLFSSNGKKPLDVSRINQIFNDTGTLAKLKHPNPNPIKNKFGEMFRKINPHLLRHSLARHLKSLGYSGEFIQNYLRHTNIETTFNEYGTMSIDEMEQQSLMKRGLIVNSVKQLNYT
jgi:integrase